MFYQHTHADTYSFARKKKQENNKSKILNELEIHTSYNQKLPPFLTAITALLLEYAKAMSYSQSSKSKANKTIFCKM